MEEKHRLSRGTIWFLMINRSLNLVLYKIFTTFSWYFSQDLKINYILFALIAIMNLPGNLLNTAVKQYCHQFRARYVIVIVELLLAISCLIMLPWHTVTGLVIARIITSFSICLLRSEVNAIIGAFTFDNLKQRAICIIEISLYLSGIGFVFVGIILQHFGWKTVFAIFGVIIIIIAICAYKAIPRWHFEQEQEAEQDSKTSVAELKQVLMHKNSQLLFLSVLLNKMAHNAFYYTLSRWLATSYGLEAQLFGCVTLCVVAGCVFPSIVEYICSYINGVLGVRILHLSIYLTSLLGAIMQVLCMIAEPIYDLHGQHISLAAACIVIFLYFCGSQILYNNALDIITNVTEQSNLLLIPAANTMLLVYGAMGGMIGTILSAAFYELGGEALIGTMCAVCNVAVSCIVILLWRGYQRVPLLTPITQKTLLDSTKPTKTYDSIEKKEDIAMVDTEETQSNPENIDGGKQMLLNTVTVDEITSDYV